MYNEPAIQFRARHEFPNRIDCTHFDKDELQFTTAEALIEFRHTCNLFSQTTATTMTWAFLHLADHPDIQDRVREEVKTVLPPEGKPLNWEQVEKLKYLTCVINETMRYVFIYISIESLLQLKFILQL